MRLPPPSSLANLDQRTWPAWLSDGDDSSPDDKLQRWSSLIGIVAAICGNALIALALNVQRYAHIRLHRKKLQIRERARQAMHNEAAASHIHGRGGPYGAAASLDTDGAPNGNGRYRDNDDDDARYSSETDPLAQSFRSDYSGDGDDTEKPSLSYLQDPYWWLGLVLITVGECGNFLAYGFAPASIVSPLGVVALVSNCIIAPIFFKEVFRQQDFWGVIIAITGAVTVVLSAQTEEIKLGPHEVWDAITTMEFEIYMAVSCTLIALLMWLSPRYGHRTILIDLGLVGLFGAYTVLSTKGVSSMLSSTLFGAFTTPVTYVLAFVLLSTAILQVRYVNKALQRFDSTQVIPIQFVLFTLSVIIGSAVLYRDFERTTTEQAFKFVGGCLLTFFGVFLITNGRPRQSSEDEVTLSDAEGIEETIGLSEQDRAPPPTPPQPRRRGQASAAASRGSSRTSRVSFSESVHGSLDFTSSGAPPTSRAPPTTSQKPLFSDDDDDEDDLDHDEDHPFLSANPWLDATDDQQPHRRPSLSRHTISSSSDPVSPVNISSDDAETQPAATSKSYPSTPPERPPLTPRTPSTPAPPRPPQLHMYSPSPFSSTLSAVVGDKLLALAGAGSSSNSQGGIHDGHSSNSNYNHNNNNSGSQSYSDSHNYSYGSSSSPTALSGSGNGNGLAPANRRRNAVGLRTSLFTLSFPANNGNGVGVGGFDGDGQVVDGGGGGGGASGVEGGADVLSRVDDGALRNGNGGEGGFRGRARSLSQALGLGGFFGGGGGTGDVSEGSGNGNGRTRRATVARGNGGNGGGNRGGGRSREGSREGGMFGGVLGE